MFTANLPLAEPEGIGVEWRDHDIFLPHEYMSWLYEFPDEFADRLHCCDAMSEWWCNARSTEWFRSHPARLEEDTMHTLPCSIYGDDAQFQTKEERFDLDLVLSALLSREYLASSLRLFL